MTFKITNTVMWFGVLLDMVCIVSQHYFWAGKNVFIDATNKQHK